jgi:hypothetical protein
MKRKLCLAQLPFHLSCHPKGALLRLKGFSHHGKDASGQRTPLSMTQQGKGN